MSGGWVPAIGPCRARLPGLVYGDIAHWPGELLEHHVGRLEPPRVGAGHDQCDGRLVAAAALAACEPVSGASGCDELSACADLLAAGVAEGDEEARCVAPAVGLSGAWLHAVTASPVATANPAASQPARRAGRLPRMRQFPETLSAGSLYPSREWAGWPSLSCDPACASESADISTRPAVPGLDPG